MYYKRFGELLVKMEKTRRLIKKSKDEREKTQIWIDKQKKVEVNHGKAK